MTCRAPDNTTTCAGTPTGAQLGYDNEGRLTSWQNAPSSPTTTDGFLYDGEGNRVEQLVTINGSITTSTTYVAGGLEEVASNAVGTTLTKYFTGVSGLPTAERVGTNGPLSYLASDGQGTVATALDSAGNVTSQQLYTPYGNSRYSSGSSPTSMGYTGQRADSSTGLDYYQARYYDPVAGQFTSADTANDGSNRYGYVGGNPTTATDPSGHYQCFDDACTRGGGTKSSSPPPPPPPPPHCTSDANCGAGKTVTITCTLKSVDSDCADYVHAITYNNGQRDDALRALHAWALGLIIGGAFIGLVVDAIEFFKGGEGILSKIFTVYYFALDLLNIVSLASGAFPQLAPVLSRVLGVANAIAGVAKGAIQLFRSLGGFAQFALDKGWIVAEGLLKGLPGMLELIAEKLVGNAVLDLVAGGAHAAVAWGYKLLADYQEQENMDIGKWCDQNPSAQCMSIPSNVVTPSLY